MRALNPGAMPPDQPRCTRCGRPKPRSRALTAVDSVMYHVPEWGTALALWVVGYALTFLPVGWIGWVSAAAFVGGGVPSVLAVRKEFRRQVDHAVERREVRQLEEMAKQVARSRAPEGKERA